METDFPESNLSTSVSSNYNLTSVIFSYTILEKVDFRTTINFVIDPDFNKFKKA